MRKQPTTMPCVVCSCKHTSPSLSPSLARSIARSHPTISIEWKWNILTQFIRLVGIGAADAALAARQRTNSSQSMRWESHSHMHVPYDDVTQIILIPKKKNNSHSQPK